MALVISGEVGWMRQRKRTTRELSLLVRAGGS
jgi:hypothetical protein